MRKTGTRPFLYPAIGGSDMKMEHGKALRRDHVCHEFGSREFVIEMQVRLENGECCEPCMVAIYVALGPLARRTLLRKQHRVTKGEIEELQHEVFALLTDDDCCKLLSYNPGSGSFKVWLAAIVDHCATDRHRKRHREASLDEIDVTIHSIDCVQEAEYLKAERIANLCRAIAELPERDLRLLDLCCDDTLTVGDIAKAMGFKVEEVRWRKQRVLKRLRRAMLDTSRTFSKKITNGVLHFAFSNVYSHEHGIMVSVAKAQTMLLGDGGTPDHRLKFPEL